MTQQAKSRVDLNLTGPHSGFEVPGSHQFGSLAVWLSAVRLGTSAARSFVSVGIGFTARRTRVGVEGSVDGSVWVRREKMGKRSIPQSRLRLAWLDSALIVAKLLGADGNRRGGASIKTLTLRDDVRLKRPTHALVCETLKHVPITRLALERAGVALAPDFNARSDGVGGRGAEAPHGAAADGDGFYARLRAPEADGDAVPRSLAFVLAYELLFGAGIEEEESRSPAGGNGNGGAKGGKGRRGQPAEELAMLRAAKAIRRATRSILSESGERDAEGYLLAQPGGRALAAVPTHSRHVRVNTLKLSVDEATRRLARHRPRVDPHVPDVLVFRPGTDLHDHPMVRSGEIVLQGKASCLPAAALEPKRGWVCVDCCAAPGNKTTHLAALVGEGGRIFAFDADGKRLKRLARNVATAGAGDVVSVRRADFLEVDPRGPEYAGVRAVLLDPSCSGSGTAGTRGDYLIAAARGETVDGTVGTGGAEGGADGARKFDPPAPHGHHPRLDKRVDALAQFQLRALLHAFEFPAAERLSYSTCSVHEAENEAVVRAALPRAAELGWRLCRAMPGWPRRGLEGAVEGAECLIRADQFEDDMEGFFVAVFVRDERSIGKEARAARDAAEKSRKNAAEERDKEREAKRARERGEEGVRAVLKKSKKKGGRPSALFR